MPGPLQSKAKWLILAPAVVGIGFGIWFFVVREPEEPTDASAQGPPPGFREMAGEVGIRFRMAFLPEEQGEKFVMNLYDHGCGLAVGDFDGDGHDDIYFVNQLGRNALYRNKGDGTFEDVTARAGVGLGDRICVGATWADTRNNGRQDLFVTSTRGGNVFFRNQGDGTFQDVTKQAGLTHVGHSQTAVFFDFDNDGYLDLLVTNTSHWTEDTLHKVQKYYPGKSLLGSIAHAAPEYNILYHNNGDGTFTDVTAKSGLKGRGWSGDVALLDYNDDGYLDVLITNMFGPSQLYRNNRDGTFTDVTKQVLGPTSFGSIGAKVFDFNNDGKLDLFLADMHSDMWMGLDWNHTSRALVRHGGEKKKYRHLFGPRAEWQPALVREDHKMADGRGYRIEEVVYGNTLFKNLGKGKFQEMSDQANLETFWPWGVAIGDFNNDGYEDVFMPAGMGYPFYHWPNYLMMNNGNETFTNRARAEGIEPPPEGIYLPQKIDGKPAPRSSRCAATADFNGDGRLEIVVNNFNDRPYYFQNQFPRKNWIAFRLRGAHRKQNPKGSNRDAIGALVKIYMGKEIMVRQVQAAGGYLSQSSKTVHFGLGDRKKIDRVVIRWPRGRIQEISHPAINQLHDLTEPDHLETIEPEKNLRP